MFIRMYSEENVALTSEETGNFSRDVLLNRRSRFEGDFIRGIFLSGTQEIIHS